jgi:hypothetical protein
MRTVSDVAATTGNLISHLVQSHGLEKRGRWSFPPRLRHIGANLRGGRGRNMARLKERTRFAARLAPFFTTCCVTKRDLFPFVPDSTSSGPFTRSSVRATLPASS